MYRLDPVVPPESIFSSSMFPHVSVVWYFYIFWYLCLFIALHYKLTGMLPCFFFFVQSLHFCIHSLGITSVSWLLYSVVPSGVVRAFAVRSGPWVFFRNNNRNRSQNIYKSTGSQLRNTNSQVNKERNNKITLLAKSGAWWNTQHIIHYTFTRWSMRYIYMGRKSPIRTDNSEGQVWMAVACLCQCSRWGLGCGGGETFRMWADRNQS